MTELTKVEFIADITSAEQEYQKAGITGGKMYKGSVVSFIKTEGDKVLCEDGSGKYYVPKNKVKIY